MPMPYTHLALAHSCLHTLVVDDPHAFYLGALMPDIRYFTGKPRDAYHFSIMHLNELASATHPPDSFVLGYGIHLLIDELWGTDQLRDAYKARFPFFIRRKLTIKLLEAILELFCLASHPVALRLRIQENDLTKVLGVSTSGALTEAVQSLQHYIDQRNLQAGLHIAQASGMYTPERLAQMQTLSNALENRLIRSLVHLCIVPPSRYIYKQLVEGALARTHEISAHKERGTVLPGTSAKGEDAA